MKEFTIPRNATREERDALIALMVRQILAGVAASRASGPAAQAPMSAADERRSSDPSP
jgi:hypothetical protein